MRIVLKASQAESKAQAIIHSLVNDKMAVELVDSLEVLDEILDIAKKKNLNITFLTNNKEFTLDQVYKLRYELGHNILPVE